MTLQGHCFWDSSKPGAPENKRGDPSAANLISRMEDSTVDTLHGGMIHVPGWGWGEGPEGGEGDCSDELYISGLLFNIFRL